LSNPVPVIPTTPASYPVPESIPFTSFPAIAPWLGPVIIEGAVIGLIVALLVGFPASIANAPGTMHNEEFGKEHRDQEP